MQTRQRFRGPGGQASIDKLRQLGFDPMEALVEAFKEIDHECKLQAQIRDGTLVRLNKDGSTKAYYADFHMACVERRADIAEKLMRYKYARVPEEASDEGQLPSLHIHVTGKDEVFTLNPQPAEDDLVVEEVRQHISREEP